MYLIYSRIELTDNQAIGQARKAQTADKKRQEQEDALEAEEASKWDQGSKGVNSKKQAEAEKKAEAARKKAERENLLKEEEASLPSKPQNASKRGQEKVAARRAGKIDDFFTPSGAPALNASGIDNALDALTLTNEKHAGTGNSRSDGIDRHPERRFKAAYAAFEESRLPSLKQEHPGLRLNQMKELIRKEFERSPLNPFNQATVSYNATKEDVTNKRKDLRNAVEERLTAK